MLISSLTYLLISNALSLRKDKSILFSKIVMVSLILISVLAYNYLFVISQDNSIGIYGGLFHVTAFAPRFNKLPYFICAVILTLTSFYPRKVDLNQYSTLTKLMFDKLTYNIQNVIMTNE
jgi:NADH-ubiquinone oxidoreductase chain 2